MLFALASNKTFKQAVRIAKQQTLQEIKDAKKVGKGIPITNSKYFDKIHMELDEAIKKFTKIKEIYKKIPECQTNFVYSKKKPRVNKGSIRT